MNIKYPTIVEDEIMYWFDILQDNRGTLISEITGIPLGKVDNVLSDKWYEKWRKND